MREEWDTGAVFIHHTVSRAAMAEYDLHCHPSHEIYLFQEGDAEYRVEGKRYRPAPGTLLLLPPNVFHGVKVLSERPYERMALHFFPALLPPGQEDTLLSPFLAGGACYPRTEGYRLEGYFSALLDCRELPEPLRSIALTARLTALLTQVGLLALRSDPAAAPPEEDGMARRLIAYVNEHYTQPLSLSELSGRFFLSKNQLNRVFRRATGTTIMDYIARKRVALAQRLIQEGEGAQRAALMAGYGDYSNYYRQCRRIVGK